MGCRLKVTGQSLHVNSQSGHRSQVTGQSQRSVVRVQRSVKSEVTQVSEHVKAHRLHLCLEATTSWRITAQTTQYKYIWRLCAHLATPPCIKSEHEARQEELGRPPAPARKYEPAAIAVTKVEHAVNQRGYNRGEREVPRIPYLQ